MQHKIQFPMQKELTVKDDADKKATSDSTNTAAQDQPKEKVKPPEVQEYEKKLSKKKRAALSRTGETGL